MGRGIALEAAQKFSKLPRELGQALSGGCTSPLQWDQYKIITFPTKVSWRDKYSSLEMIESGVLNLIETYYLPSDFDPCDKDYPTQLFLPRLGCGNGHLSWEKQVKPLLEQVIPDHLKSYMIFCY